MKRTTNDIYRAAVVCLVLGALGVLDSDPVGIFGWMGAWGVLLVGMAILLIPEQKLPAIYGRLGEHLEVA